MGGGGKSLTGSRGTRGWWWWGRRGPNWMTTVVQVYGSCPHMLQVVLYTCTSRQQALYRFHNIPTPLHNAAGGADRSNSASIHTTRHSE